MFAFRRSFYAPHGFDHDAVADEMVLGRMLSALGAFRHQGISCFHHVLLKCELQFAFTYCRLLAAVEHTQRVEMQNDEQVVAIEMKVLHSE